MSLILQLLIIGSGLILFAFILHLVIKNRLLLKYALLWIVLALAILIVSLFPQIIYTSARILGVNSPSNFAFLIGVFFLLIITLSLSVIVSWQSQYIKNLVQTVALLEKRVNDTFPSMTKDPETSQEHHNDLPPQ